MTESHRQKNWFQRHWKWFVPFVILLLSIPIFKSSLGGALKDYGTLYTNPSLYENALTQVSEHPEASDYLGIPIKAGFLAEGEVRYSGDGNSVTMTIPIKGSNLKVRLDIKADKVNDEWMYSLIRVRNKKAKKTIDVLKN